MSAILKKKSTDLRLPHRRNIYGIYQKIKNYSINTNNQENSCVFGNYYSYLFIKLLEDENKNKKRVVQSFALKWCLDYDLKDIQAHTFI